MKKIIRFFLFLIVIAGALAITKPTDKDFESWVKNKYAHKREKATGENVIEKLADKGAKTATELQILTTYRYTDLIFAAKTEAWANGEKKNSIGFAKIWIALP
jgi:hypothetical protein